MLLKQKIVINSMLGKPVADLIYKEIDEILKNNPDKKPVLAIIQVGDDPATNIYVKKKQEACQRLKFGFELHKFDTHIHTSNLVSAIAGLNEDSTVTGIIVQLPLPHHIDKIKILNAVNPKKDVDCFNYQNVGKLAHKPSDALFIPATVYGIYRMIQYYQIETVGKCCVIIGKSDIVGKPLQLLLSDENGMACTTILCDKHTQNLENYTRMADILIVASGKHFLINDPDWIKHGAVVIDVGIHHIGNKKVEGDVDYDKVRDRCRLITPVPGGIGPCTVAALLFNLARA